MRRVEDGNSAESTTTTSRSLTMNSALPSIGSLSGSVQITAWTPSARRVTSKALGGSRSPAAPAAIARVGATRRVRTGAIERAVIIVVSRMLTRAGTRPFGSPGSFTVFLPSARESRRRCRGLRQGAERRHDGGREASANPRSRTQQVLPLAAPCGGEDREILAVDAAVPRVVHLEPPLRGRQRAAQAERARQPGHLARVHSAVD